MLRLSLFVGIGNCVLHACLFLGERVGRVVGIEFAAARHRAALQARGAARVKLRVNEWHEKPSSSSSTPFTGFDRSEFVHGDVMDHLPLLASATHLYCFDKAFSCATHADLLAFLFSPRCPPPLPLRILVSSWPVAKLQARWRACLAPPAVTTAPDLLGQRLELLYEQPVPTDGNETYTLYVYKAT